MLGASVSSEVVFSVLGVIYEVSFHFRVLLRKLGTSFLLSKVEHCTTVVGPTVVPV